MKLLRILTVLMLAMAAGDLSAQPVFPILRGKLQSDMNGNQFNITNLNAVYADDLFGALDGSYISDNSVSSNKLDAATRALLGGTGGGTATNFTDYFWNNRNPSIVSVNYTNFEAPAASLDALTNLYFLEIGGYSQIRQAGPISRVEIVIDSVANLTAFYFDVWRPRAGTWDRVYREDIRSKIAVGTNNVTLATNYVTQVGDQIGWGYTGAAAIRPIRYIGKSLSRWTTNSPASTFNWSSGTTLSSSIYPIRVFMQSPSMLFIGDSITLGSPVNLSGWAGDDGLTTVPSNSYPYLVASNYNVTYQNLGDGGATTPQIYRLQYRDFGADLNPRLVVYQGIVNDIYYSGTNASAKAAYLDACRSVFELARSRGQSVLCLKPMPNTATITTNMYWVMESWVDEAVEISQIEYPSTVLGWVDPRPYVGIARAGGPATNLWAWDTGMSTDGIHPSLAGYQKTANAIIDFISTNTSSFQAVVQGSTEVAGNLHVNGDLYATTHIGSGAGLTSIPQSAVDGLTEQLDYLLGSNALSSFDLLLNTNGTWLSVRGSTAMGTFTRALDSTTHDFISRAGLTNIVEIGAIDYYVRSLKATNLWGKADMIHLYRPSAAGLNLVSTNGNFTFTGLYASNYTYDGVLGNMAGYGSNNLGLTNLAHYTQNDASMMVFVEGTPTPLYMWFGVADEPNQRISGFTQSQYPGPEGIINGWIPWLTLVGSDLTNAWVLNRTNSAGFTIWGAGKSYYAPQVSTNIPATKLGALTAMTANGVPYYPSDVLLGVSWIGGGLTTEEIAELQDITESYMATLKLEPLSDTVVGTLVVGNDARVIGNVTATRYYGDGSHLTGMTGGIATNVVWIEAGTNIYATTNFNVIRLDVPSVAASAQTNISVAGVTNAGTAAYSNSAAFYLSSNPSNFVTAIQAQLADTDLTNWAALSTNVLTALVNVPQTNISYTAVTNAPWQLADSDLTNWATLSTNVLSGITGQTNWPISSITNAGHLTNWALVSTSSVVFQGSTPILSGISITGAATGSITFTNSGGKTITITGDDTQAANTNISFPSALSAGGNYVAAGTNITAQTNGNLVTVNSSASGVGWSLIDTNWGVSVLTNASSQLWLSNSGPSFTLTQGTNMGIQIYTNGSSIILSNSAGAGGGTATNVVWPVAGTNIVAVTNGNAVTISVGTNATSSGPSWTLVQGTNTGVTIATNASNQLILSATGTNAQVVVVAGTNIVVQTNGLAYTINAGTNGGSGGTYVAAGSGISAVTNSSLVTLSTTSSIPAWEIVQGTNYGIQWYTNGTSLIASNSAGAGSGTVQTNISYTAVTNAPWQFSSSALTNLSNNDGGSLTNLQGTNIVGPINAVILGTLTNNTTGSAQFVTTSPLTNQSYASNIVGLVSTTYASNVVGVAGGVLSVTNEVITQNALGTTITPTVWLTNGTAAALGAQQNSPALMFGGQGWRSGNSTTMPVQLGFYLLPSQGSTANPLSYLILVKSVSNAAPSSVQTFFTSDGTFNAANNIISANQVKAPYLTADDTGGFSWVTRSYISSPANSSIQFLNNGSTAFNQLFFGPLTANWPSLKVVSTNNPGLQFRNGDDTQFTSATASNFVATANLIASNSIVSYGTGTSNYIGGNLTTLLTETASNFVHSAWKWIDVLSSGESVVSNPAGDPPVLTEVPGQNYFGYGYYFLDKSYFNVQGPHKLAMTNAVNPALFFQPHCHVSTTNVTAGTNASFAMELYYGAVHGYLTNYYASTNSATLTNTYGHYMINFGNVTNNALIGRSSVIWRGRVMRVDGGAGDIGATSPVWVDSVDIHVPVQEFGTIGQQGD